MNSIIRQYLKQLFLQKIKYRINKNGCWIVESHKPDTEGYARIQSVHGRFYIHRLSFYIHKGKIKKGNVICHKCDNPLCVNPDHLFQSSQKKNMIDKVKKNRSGDTRSKLNYKQRKEILNSNLSSYQLSKIYGVTPYAIRFLRRN